MYLGQDPSCHGRCRIMHVVDHFGENESLFLPPCCNCSSIVLCLQQGYMWHGIPFLESIHVGTARGDTWKSPMIKIKSLCMHGMCLIATIYVIGDKLCQAQSLTTTFHLVHFIPWFLGNRRSIMHGILESNIIGNTKYCISTIHQDSFNGHVDKFPTSTMSTLRGECSTNFSIDSAPTSRLTEIIPKLLHTVRHASQISWRTNCDTIRPIQI
mmetsp:Transcript_17382/g.32971  ORF Transcript_17382/g.32971 Transcript_17382/m.32971 type:complete len:212 (+) Transcript_17382:792-1427(+)